MIHNVYAVFDHCAKAFLPPFLLRNDGQAVRAFKDCVNSKSHQFSEHPEDYQLFCLGTFDDTLGDFTNQEPGARNLGNGLALVTRTVDETQITLAVNND